MLLTNSLVNCSGCVTHDSGKGRSSGGRPLYRCLMYCERGWKDVVAFCDGASKSHCNGAGLSSLTQPA